MIVIRQGDSRPYFGPPRVSWFRSAKQARHTSPACLYSGRALGPVHQCVLALGRVIPGMLDAVLTCALRHLTWNCHYPVT